MNKYHKDLYLIYSEGKINKYMIKINKNKANE